MSRIHKLSGQNLHHSRVMIPHGTNFDEADITDGLPTTGQCRARRRWRQRDDAGLIIKAPEVAILSVTRTSMKPVWNDSRGACRWITARWAAQRQRAFWCIGPRCSQTFGKPCCRHERSTTSHKDKPPTNRGPVSSPVISMMKSDANLAPGQPHAQKTEAQQCEHRRLRHRRQRIGRDRETEGQRR